ncbi:hypothetical protein DPX16_8661 [Anabarilius grahami]|uniref:Uncharacterized protein n=1 Tax=Anabarilius grahami TaxID=495550 RepID=A0A3N0Y9G0_ANAGA|nr:hypothetical protein DPX16_8661 [Anabarilius grahami]
MAGAPREEPVHPDRSSSGSGGTEDCWARGGLSLIELANTLILRSPMGLAKRPTPATSGQRSAFRVLCEKALTVCVHCRGAERAFSIHSYGRRPSRSRSAVWDWQRTGESVESSQEP